MTSSAMRKISHFVDCSGVTQDPEQLRYLAAQNGYLYFPGLLPAEDVLALRRAILHIADRHSLLRADLDVGEGIRKEGGYIDVEYDKPTSPALQRFYNEILSLRLFNAFPHHPMVMGLIESLFGEPTFVHPRNICHILIPARFGHTTDPHQDFHQVGGTQNTWTRRQTEMT